MAVFDVQELNVPNAMVLASDVEYVPQIVCQLSPFQQVQPILGKEHHSPLRVGPEDVHHPCETKL
jgi:hypothetical protein